MIDPSESALGKHRARVF
jgi:ubiquinone biosynthesis protein